MVAAHDSAEPFVGQEQANIEWPAAFIGTEANWLIARKVLGHPFERAHGRRHPDTLQWPAMRIVITAQCFETGQRQ
ncbi:MAG TPA: hypothetical protein PKC74_11165, partial [Turneriella sp.]|nr:hypothetical protein [Turneriella sp.]